MILKQALQTPMIDFYRVLTVYMWHIFCLIYLLVLVLTNSNCSGYLQRFLVTMLGCEILEVFISMKRWDEKKRIRKYSRLIDAYDSACHVRKNGSSSSHSLPVELVCSVEALGSSMDVKTLKRDHEDIYGDFRRWYYKHVAVGVVKGCLVITFLFFHPLVIATSCSQSDTYLLFKLYIVVFWVLFVLWFVEIIL